MGFPTKNDHFWGCFFGVITTILGNLQLVSGRVPKLNELTGFRARISDWDIQGSDRCIRSSSLHIGKSLHATGIGFKWWSGLPWMFVYSLGIQSPSDNGNGTSIPCLGGDCTPQPSSNKAIGSLGIVATKTVVDILGIARAKTPVTQWIFFQCSIAIQFLWRKAYQPLVYPLFIYIYICQNGLVDMEILFSGKVWKSMEMAVAGLQKIWCIVCIVSPGTRKKHTVVQKKHLPPKMFTDLQGGPPPLVLNGLITPISKVITPVTHLTNHL